MIRCNNVNTEITQNLGINWIRRNGAENFLVVRGYYTQINAFNLQHMNQIQFFALSSFKTCHKSALNRVALQNDRTTHKIRDMFRYTLPVLAVLKNCFAITMPQRAVTASSSLNNVINDSHIATATTAAFEVRQCNIASLKKHNTSKS